jgi:hypothetical protein
LFEWVRNKEREKKKIRLAFFWFPSQEIERTRIGKNANHFLKNIFFFLLLFYFKRRNREISSNKRIQ